MAGEPWKAGGHTMYLTDNYYMKIAELAKQEHRPKTQQLQVIIDFYFEHHPVVSDSEEGRADEESKKA